jgi:outer membrane protein assembly factor BamD
LKALEEFRRLKQKFPQDENVPKAEKYLAQCRSDLAEHEFYVGRFYLKTKHYAAALERFQILAQEYPEFPKQNEVKNYTAECQRILAEPEKKATGWTSHITSLFDARW